MTEQQEFNTMIAKAFCTCGGQSSMDNFEFIDCVICNPEEE